LPGYRGGRHAAVHDYITLSFLRRTLLESRLEESR
jgi:hypothetical protein